MPGFLDSMDSYALTRTVKGYSSGTKVNVQNFTKAHTVFISIIATREVLEVSQDDIVKLRPRFRIVNDTRVHDDQPCISQEVEGGYR